jgi:hypothetical protein
LPGFGCTGIAVEERVSGRYDFENEFQFQLQGYASAAQTVNLGPHNLV